MSVAAAPLWSSWGQTRLGLLACTSHMLKYAKESLCASDGAVDWWAARRPTIDWGSSKRRSSDGTTKTNAATLCFSDVRRSQYTHGCFMGTPADPSRRLRDGGGGGGLLLV
jgi:hypothetical protein